MSTLQDAMRALGGELNASVLRTAGIEHNLTKGELREDDLRRAFRPYIPQRYELSSGVVVNIAGRQSLQQDVIVSDAVANPSFIAGGGMTVQPIEAVVATLEVKSVATTGMVRNGVKKALSVAGLLSDVPRSTYKRGIGAQLLGSTSVKPFAGFVALKSSAPRHSLLEAWATAHVRDRPWDRSNAMVVAGDFVACWTNPDGGWISLADPRSSKIACINAGDDALLMFYILLMMAMRDYPGPGVRSGSVCRSSRDRHTG